MKPCVAPVVVEPADGFGTFGTSAMHDMRAALQSLHAESFGWSLCCCRRERMRAEDVLQQVYVKVLTGKARFEGKGSFKTWLFGVIRRTAGEDHRRQWGRRLILARYWEGLMGVASPGSAAGALPSEACEAGELREAFGAALLALPPRQSEVLHLVFYQELSISGAAEVMGISVGSARTHYERGKKALRATLAPFDDSRELTHVQPIA